MRKRQSKGGNGSASPEQAAGELSKFQSFTTEAVHRSRIKNAAYNPRYITASAKTKLKAALKAVGLVQPLVWNRRTENLVGGHQRLSQLDSLEGTADYALTLAVIDVDEKREREINVLLNNQDVAGEWDLEKLKKVLDAEIDLLNTGFDHAAFMQMFGEAPSQPKAEHQEDLSKQLADVKAAYAKLSESIRSKDDTDFYNVVVFGSYNERAEFLKEFGLADNRYVDGRTLVKIFRDIKESLSATPRNKGKRGCISEDEAERAKEKA